MKKKTAKLYEQHFNMKSYISTKRVGKGEYTYNMKYKVKVCDRFNTIEWETETPTTEECQKMYDILSAMKLNEQEIVKKKTTTVTTTTPAKSRKPASPAQLKLLRQKSIPYEDDITAQEAFLLLQKNSNVYPNKNID